MPKIEKSNQILRLCKSSNKLVLDYYGLHSDNQLIGYTDKDRIADIKTGERFIKNDQSCLKTDTAVVYNEYGKLAHGPFNCISIKTPMHENDRIVGLLGISLYLEDTSMSDLQSFVNILQGYFNEHLDTLPQHLNRLNSRPDLSQREKQIIPLYCRGFSAMLIAQSLYLSVRTIEGYIASLKAKLYVSKKNELNQKISELYPELI